MKKGQKKKGFSLLETIISIAVLSIISGFILEMFMVSSELNQRAKDVDIGSNLAMNRIEQFKGAHSIETFLQESFLQQAQIGRDDDTGRTYIAQFYDKDWNAIKVDWISEWNNVDEINGDNKPEGAKFLLKISVENDGEDVMGYDKIALGQLTTPKKMGSLIYMEANITDITGIEKFRDVADFSASKYFLY